jgi:hypothetical protein
MKILRSLLNSWKDIDNKRILKIITFILSKIYLLYLILNPNNLIDSL